MPSRSPRRQHLCPVVSCTDLLALAFAEGTPFEGGAFRMKLVLGKDFPQAPPKGFFLTKIFHPNVSKTGAICVNTLKKDWKPSHGIGHVLTVVKCLLIHPNPESALNEEAGKLLLEQYDDFARHAKMMTEIHAKPSGQLLPDSADKASETTLMQDGTVSKKRLVDKSTAAKDKKKKKNLKRL